MPLFLALAIGLTAITAIAGVAKKKAKAPRAKATVSKPVTTAKAAPVKASSLRTTKPGVAPSEPKRTVVIPTTAKVTAGKTPAPMDSALKVLSAFNKTQTDVLSRLL